MSKKKIDEVTTDEDGKLRMSPDQFQYAFAELLKRMPAVVLNAKAVDLKANPVTPGVGERVISADTWHKRWKGSGDAAADDWYERTLTPRKDPIDTAVKANEKRKDRLAAAEKAEKWVKKMKNLKKEDVFEGVIGAGVEGYKGGLDSKSAKTKRRIEALRPKVLALAEAIDKLADKTDADREKKMLAARRGMIQIGQGESISVEGTRAPT